MTVPEERVTDEELAELLAEVRRIEVQSRRLVSGALAGGYTSVFRGAGIEFDEVREFAPGDDPRSVDWNVTAKMGRPFVKKYVDERELTLVFLLDLSPSMTGGFGAWSPRQMAARVCGCLALSAVRHNDKIGLVAFDDSVRKFVPPKKGLGHALRIVRDCLALPPASARTQLAPALDFVGHVVRRRAVVFLVSDFLASGYARSLSLCARRHDVVAMRLQPAEMAPPVDGLMVLRDPEGGTRQVVDWSHAATRDAFRARVARWRDEHAAALARARVDLMDVPVPFAADRDAVARPLLTFFRMRELRGSKR
ncbi:MAG: DUF58 domain-containing protein [Planctomycetota bacterium]